MEQDHRREQRRLSWWSLLSLGLLWLAGCTTVESAQPTLVPTLSLPINTATEIPTPSVTPTATITATFTPEPVISNDMIVTMGAKQVRATDMARPLEEVDRLIELLPKPVTEASVALYAINLNSGKFELAGTGVVVEYDEVKKKGIILTSRHVVEARSGAFLQNLQVGQPHKNDNRLTLNTSTMDIVPGPFGDIGFVTFSYEGDPPYPALGRENIEMDAIVTEDMELGMLSFTDSAVMHGAYPVVGFRLSSKQSELFDTQWNMRGYIAEHMVAKQQSGTSIVDMKTGKVKGIYYGMHEDGGVFAPILSGTFDVLD